MACLPCSSATSLAFSDHNYIRLSVGDFFSCKVSCRVDVFQHCSSSFVPSKVSLVFLWWLCFDGKAQSWSSLLTYLHSPLIRICLQVSGVDLFQRTLNIATLFFLWNITSSNVNIKFEPFKRRFLCNANQARCNSFSLLTELLEDTASDLHIGNNRTQFPSFSLQCFGKKAVYGALFLIDIVQYWKRAAVNRWKLFRVEWQKVGLTSRIWSGNMRNVVR